MESEREREQRVGVIKSSLTDLKSVTKKGEI